MRIGPCGRRYVLVQFRPPRIAPRAIAAPGTGGADPGTGGGDPGGGIDPGDPEVNQVFTLYTATLTVRSTVAGESNTQTHYVVNLTGTGVGPGVPPPT